MGRTQQTAEMRSIRITVSIRVVADFLTLYNSKTGFAVWIAFSFLNLIFFSSISIKTQHSLNPVNSCYYFLYFHERKTCFLGGCAN